MSQTRRGLTEAQHKIVGALDDANEHLHWELDPSEYESISTIGFAWIKIPDGRCSFVQMIQRMADHHVCQIEEKQRGPSQHEYTWSFGATQYTLRPGHDGGYRLDVSANHLFDGPGYQRIDAQERVHRLVLNRLQRNGYLNDAGVRSRMD